MPCSSRPALTETSMDNPFADLHELLTELKLPITAVVNNGLGVTTTCYYAWRDNPMWAPVERVEQARDLYDTLVSYRERGLLPLDKQDLIWWGLVYLTELKK